MKRRSFIKSGAMAASALGTIGNSVVYSETGLQHTNHTKAVQKADKIRVAVVQQDANPGQVNYNRDKALKTAKDALEQGADVILFHEELLIGYVENAHELAEPVDGPTSRAFQDLLKGTDSLIIYGLLLRTG